jgi:putative endonuclease
MQRQPCVYILASRRHGTIYIGVTSDLFGRLYQHRTKAVRGFTGRYAVYRLVHFELADTMDAAIAREKQLKAWKRDWKIALIEERNPTWYDLAVGLGFEPLAATR